MFGLTDRASIRVLIGITAVWSTFLVSSAIWAIYRNWHFLTSWIH